MNIQLYGVLVALSVKLSKVLWFSSQIDNKIASCKLVITQPTFLLKKNKNKKSLSSSLKSTCNFTYKVLFKFISVLISKPITSSLMLFRLKAKSSEERLL